MYESQGVSLDSTAAPLPKLEVSSQPITVNAGGDGFSPVRCSTTATVVHADHLDLTSTFFSTADPDVLRARMLVVQEPSGDKWQIDAHIVHVTIRDMDATLEPVRAKLMTKVQSLLDWMHQLRSLSSFEENSGLVNKIKEYAAICQGDLLFTDPKKGLENEPVALECLDAEDQKTGRFRLRTYTTPAKIVYTRKSFPRLCLASSISHAATFAEEPSGDKWQIDAHTVHVTIRDMDAALGPVRAKLMTKVQSLLDWMHQLKSLSSFEENSGVVNKIKEYAAICQGDLLFTDPKKGLEKAPVAFECLDAENLKAGRFRLRTHTTPAKTVYARTSFPRLGLASSISHAATFADRSSSFS